MFHCEPTYYEQQHQSIAYLHARAFEAHNDGDGVLVNHLCSIALSNIEKWVKKGKCDVLLSETYWIAVLSLYWLIDVYMLNKVKTVYEVMPCNKDDVAISLILKNTFILIKECLSIDISLIDALKTSSLSWCIDTYNEEDALLLTLIIELLWYKNPIGNKWHELSTNWYQKLYNSNQRLAEELEKTRQRLEIQNYLVTLGAPSCVKTKLDNYFPRPIEKYLYDAWGYILKCNWKKVRKCIKNIVNMVTYEDPIALYVSDIHQRFRFHIHMKESNNEDCGDPEIITLTRRRVYLVTRKSFAFTEQRIKKLMSDAVTLWWKGETKITSEERFNCFRIVMFSELSALRVWDISSWIDLTRIRAMLNLEVTRFNGEQYYGFLINAIIKSIQSLSFDEKDPLISCAIQKLDFTNESLRKILVNCMVNTRPLEWHKVFELFVLLSDGVPESCLLKLANWSIKCNKFRGELPGWHVAPFAFWGTIISHCNIDSRVYESLYPVALHAAQHPAIWEIDNKECFLQEYLLHAPSLLAIKIGEKMLDIMTVDERSIENRWNLLYNASLKRSELSERFKQQLSESTTNPVRSHYLYYLEHPDEPFVPRDNSELRDYNRQQIYSTINPELKKIDSNAIDNNLIGLVTWTEDDLHLVSLLTDAINYPQASPFEIENMIECLSILVLKGGHIYIENIRKEYLNWLNVNPSGNGFAPNYNGPFSSFHMDLNEKEGIFKSLCLLSVSMISDNDPEIKSIVGNWVINNIIEAPMCAYGLLSKIAITIGLSTEGMNGINIINIVRFLLMKASSDTTNIKQSQNAIFSILFQIYKILNSQNIQFVSESSNNNANGILIQILYQFIPTLAKHNDANIRMGVAYILNKWSTLEELPIELDDVYNTLCKDARGRVRQATKKT